MTNVSLELFQNSTNILDILNVMDGISGGALVTLMIITLWMVTFLSFSANGKDSRDALFGATIVALVGGILLAGSLLVVSSKLIFIGVFMLATLGLLSFVGKNN